MSIQPAGNHKEGIGQLKNGGVDRLMRSIKKIPLMMGLLLMMSGCLGAGAGEADDLLSQALSGLMGEDDFTFTGTTTLEMSDAQLRSGFNFNGQVNDHNEIDIEPDTGGQGEGYTASALQVSGKLSYTKVNRQWTVSQSSDRQLHPMFTLNPIIHAEYLNRAVRDVAIVSGEAEEKGRIVLRASPDQELLTDDFKKLVRAEHNRVVAEVKGKAQSSDDEELAAELAAYVQQAEKQLGQILDTLQVASEYRIVMDKRSRRLLEMIYTAELQYNVNDEPHKEAIRTSYQFQG